jgi:hypothetical protein
LKSSTANSKLPLWKVKTSAQQDKLFTDSEVKSLEMAKKKLKLKKKKVKVCVPVMDPSISSQQVSLSEVQNQMLPLAETAPGADSARTEQEKMDLGVKIEKVTYSEEYIEPPLLDTVRGSDIFGQICHSDLILLNSDSESESIKNAAAAQREGMTLKDLSKLLDSPTPSEAEQPRVRIPSRSINVKIENITEQIEKMEQSLVSNASISGIWTRPEPAQAINIDLKLEVNQNFSHSSYTEEPLVITISDDDSSSASVPHFLPPPQLKVETYKTLRKLMHMDSEESLQLFSYMRTEKIVKSKYVLKALSLHSKLQKGLDQLSENDKTDYQLYRGHMVAYKIRCYHKHELCQFVTETESNTEVRLTPSPGECSNCQKSHSANYRCLPITTNCPIFLDNPNTVTQLYPKGYIMGLRYLVVQPPVYRKLYGNLSVNPREKIDYSVSEQGLELEEIRVTPLYQAIVKRLAWMSGTGGVLFIEFIHSAIPQFMECPIEAHLLCFLEIVREATKLLDMTVIVLIHPPVYVPGQSIAEYRTGKALYFKLAFSALQMGTAIGVGVYPLYLQSIPLLFKKPDGKFVIDPENNVKTPEFFSHPIFGTNGHSTYERLDRIQLKIDKLRTALKSSKIAV